MSPSDDGSDAQPASVAPEVEASLQPVIKDLPGPKQQEIVQTVERTVEQTVMAVIRGGNAGPQIDPETAKIFAATLDHDNENKFKYLTQKQSDIAAKDVREHDVCMARHKDLIRPIVWAVILIGIGSVAAGIYFIANGKEAVGSALLTGIFGALLGYLAGLGTSAYTTTPR